jgi:hypothetical protein
MLWCFRATKIAKFKPSTARKRVCRCFPDGYADRLRDHCYFANLFRLYLHTMACNLLVRMRREVADPPRQPSNEEVPAEAFACRQRHGWHNRHRDRDPLGEGQPCTWRIRLIKVAARVRETSRRVVVELSASWPYLDHYRQVVQCLLVDSLAAPNPS